MRKSFLVAAVLLYITSSAAVIGVYPVQDEKHSDTMSGKFRLGIINTENESVKFRFSAGKSSRYNVSFEKNPVFLEPSEVTENPSGSGWYHLGNGRYARQHTVDFQLTVRDYKSSIDVPVTVYASKGGGGGTAKMVYVREHSFSLKLSDSLKPIETGESDPEWAFTPSKDGEKEDTAEEGEKNRSETTYKSDEGEEEDGGEEINPVTVILLAGIVILSAYLLKVV